MEDINNTEVYSNKLTLIKAGSILNNLKNVTTAYGLIDISNVKQLQLFLINCNTFSLMNSLSSAFTD
jgi:hypothetical protein